MRSRSNLLLPPSDRFSLRENPSFLLSSLFNYSHVKRRPDWYITQQSSFSNTTTDLTNRFFQIMVRLWKIRPALDPFRDTLQTQCPTSPEVGLSGKQQMYHCPNFGQTLCTWQSDSEMFINSQVCCRALVRYFSWRSKSCVVVVNGWCTSLTLYAILLVHSSLSWITMGALIFPPASAICRFSDSVERCGGGSGGSFSYLDLKLPSSRESHSQLSGGRHSSRFSPSCWIPIESFNVDISLISH